jgi:hypothetical protein
VLWIVVALAVAALLTVVAVQQSRAPGGVSLAAWVRGGALLLLVLVTLRFGTRLLPLVGPVAMWLVWGLLGASQRRRQPAWTSGGSRGSRMSRDEALRVLGLAEGASKAQVQDAHRRLIKKLHPDQGGSSLLAQQVNEAKLVLLEE